MKTLQDKIDAIREEMSAKEPAEIERVTIEHHRVEALPDTIRALYSAGRVALRDVDFNQTLEISCRALNMAEVYGIIDAYYNEGRLFQPVNLYHNGCGAVTAYPYSNFNESNKEWAVKNGVVLYSSAGKGFQAFELAFYPVRLDGSRVKVSIRMHSMHNEPYQFHAHASAEYNRSGNVIAGTVNKRPPEFSKHAERVVPFGAGSLDACNYYSVFTADKFLEALAVTFLGRQEVAA